MAQEKIHVGVDLGLMGRPMVQVPTELKEIEGEMKMSNSRRGETRIELRRSQSRGKRVCSWQRGRGHHTADVDASPMQWAKVNTEPDPTLTLLRCGSWRDL